MVYQLSEKYFGFPDPLDVPASEHERSGLFAVGGKLTVDWMIEAYLRGIFPWTDFRLLDVPEGVEPHWYNQVHWFCPMRRFVIFPNEVHISHSMRTLMNKGVYRVTFNEDFDGVIHNCSQLRIDTPGAWLGPQMIAVMKKMHALGFAQSVEVWHDDRLVGGLYGVTLGRGFFGESMFSLEPSASKLALITLAQALVGTEYQFIDCQIRTPHLASMGGRYIPYHEYMRLLYPESEE